MKNSFNVDLDLYSFLSKLCSYIFLAFCFLYQFQSQPYIINQTFLYFNLSIVSSVFILIFFVALDFFGDRKFKSLFWFMFILDIFVLFSIAEFGSLSPLLFSFLLCANILACSIVLSSAMTHLVSGLSCVMFTIFFIRSGFADSSASLVFFIVNLMGMSIISFLGQGLKEKIFVIKERMDLMIENLKKQKILNQVIFDSIKSSVFVLSPKGALISTNTKGEELLSEYKFLISRVKSVFQEAKNDHAKLDLGERHFSVLRSPLTYKDHRDDLGEVYLATDETLKIKLSEQLNEAEKLAAVGRLSAGLAHEIRNPLAGISGSVELLKDTLDSSDKENHKLYSIVIREIDRLNALVTEFLSFARPEVQMKDSISIKEFLSEILAILKHDPRVKSTRVQFDISAENYLVVVDRDKFKQAVMNIIINAAQATEGVSSNRSVSIKGLVIDEGYKILIRDNGVGIDKEHLNKIFEPFHTTKDKGTGLGLAVTRRILESHGATLSVDSELGEGTSFSIIIPKKESGVNFVENLQSLRGK